MPPEEWRPVVGFEGLYEVSSLGRVKRVTPGPGTHVGRILTAYTTPVGHKQVRLSLSPDVKPLIFVHRLVADAFIGPQPTPNHRVLHWDDVPDNNHVSNLRWGTQGDNLRDAVRNGTHAWSKRTHCAFGHPLSGDNVKPRGGGEGGRRCVTCTRDRQNNWYRERRDRDKA